MDVGSYNELKKFVEEEKAEYEKVVKWATILAAGEITFSLTALLIYAVMYF